MFNCYNIAHNYLEQKYDLKMANWLVRLNLPDNACDVDKEINLLMHQYFFGIPAKIELWYKLIEIGEISPNIDPFQY